MLIFGNLQQVPKVYAMNQAHIASAGLRLPDIEEQQAIFCENGKRWEADFKKWAQIIWF